MGTDGPPEKTSGVPEIREGLGKTLRKVEKFKPEARRTELMEPKVIVDLNFPPDLVEKLDHFAEFLQSQTGKQYGRSKILVEAVLNYPPFLDWVQQSKKR